MITINCIAIDDEPPALRQMVEYISKVPYLNLLATFTNPIDVISFLRENQVELIFLDIQMEHLSGIELLKLLKEQPKVVLTTAFDSYALQAFDLDVDDYLLKPISFTRFVKATEKIYNELLLKKQPNPLEMDSIRDEKDFFFVKSEFRIEKIDFSDILYIEGMKEYLIIFLEGSKKVYTLQSFNDILSNMPKSNFIRVHKSYIVPLKKISSIRKNKIMIGEKAIPVGSTFRESFFNAIQK